MNIALFYRDAFGGGGVPGEIREIANAFVAEGHTVHYWGRTGTIPDALAPAVTPHPYRSARELSAKITPWLQTTRPDLVILVGFFLHDNLPVAKAAKRLGIPVILNPVVQVSDSVLGGKIFTRDPDVRKLEQQGQNALNLCEKLKNTANPLLKQAYLNSVGRMLLHHTDYVAVFSEFETAQFQKHLSFPDEKFLPLRWGIDQTPTDDDTRHYYRDVLGYNDHKANYVYWGRLDWHYKGIDRLLSGVLHARDTQDGELPFRVFLIGPDYHGGAEKARAYIEAHGLQDVVHLMLPGSYPAGTKTPLRDASASLYLSRWDGFARTLRESVMMDVPLLVSEETHFGELIARHHNGRVPQNADDPAQVAEALMALSQNSTQLACRDGARTLAPLLSWRQGVRDMLDGLHALTPENRTALP